MTFQFHSPHHKILPHDIPLVRPPAVAHDTATLERIIGSLVGLAVGDALGASVEFRPRQYLIEHPVHDMMSGGTWGLRAGQWTDDTSMALCLASSLITQRGFNPYDQMVRYKWWYKHGYLSSTGQCFDIGNATRNSLEEFYRRQQQLKRDHKLRTDQEVDQLPVDFLQKIQFNVYCSREGVAGNGALMRLAPVPLFFYRIPDMAVELSGRSARLTHGDDVAVDACRYYGALIVAAVSGESKEDLLSDQFYDVHQTWFGSEPLHDEILYITKGSFKKPRGYKDGIRGKGHIVLALEAALWAFWSTESFEKGVLNAVNLGDDTDTTAAIYGQLAGAYYSYRNIPPKWVDKLYANKLIVCMAEWLQYLGHSKRETPGQRSAIHIKGQFDIPSKGHESRASPIKPQPDAPSKEFQSIVLSKERQSHTRSKTLQSGVSSKKLQSDVISKELQSNLTSEKPPSGVRSTTPEPDALSKEFQSSSLSKERQSRIRSKTFQSDVWPKKSQSSAPSKKLQSRISSKKPQSDVILKELQSNLPSEKPPSGVRSKEVQSDALSKVPHHTKTTQSKQLKSEVNEIPKRHSSGRRTKSVQKPKP
jgi:ADP-ribosyl-[dinitrogen reductase] hydrolase